MIMASLKDQLLKAGLVSEDKVKSVEKEQKKRSHLAHKDKQIRAEIDYEKKQTKQLIEASEQEKKLKAKEANQKVQQANNKKALRIEARRIIDEKRVNDKSALDTFNFSSDGKKIRYVKVTEQQRKQLGTGELAICRNDRDGFDYPLLPRINAERLVEIENLSGERWIYFFISPDEINSNMDADELAAWEAYEAELKKIGE